ESAEQWLESVEQAGEIEGGLGVLEWYPCARREWSGVAEIGQAQSEIALSDEVLVGHRGQGVAVDDLLPIEPEGHFGVRSVHVDGIDAAHPDTGDPDVVADTQSGDIG